MINSRCLNTLLKRGDVTSSCLQFNRSLIATSSQSNTLLGIRKSVLTESERKTMATSTNRTLTLDSLNPNVIKMEYAVRGPLVIRAGEIEKELKQVITLQFLFFFVISINFNCLYVIVAGAYE